jgi:hypothetical protein
MQGLGAHTLVRMTYRSVDIAVRIYTYKACSISGRGLSVTSARRIGSQIDGQLVYPPSGSCVHRGNAESLQAVACVNFEAPIPQRVLVDFTERNAAMRKNASERTIGVMLDPSALRALDDQLHDQVDDLDALERARAAVGMALRSLSDPSVGTETPTTTGSIGVNVRVIGVSAAAGLGIGTVVAVIPDSSGSHYRVHFDGQPAAALYFCRADHIRMLG